MSHKNVGKAKRLPVDKSQLCVGPDNRRSGDGGRFIFVTWIAAIIMSRVEGRRLEALPTTGKLQIGEVESSYTNIINLLTTDPRRVARL